MDFEEISDTKVRFSKIVPIQKISKFRLLQKSMLVATAMLPRHRAARKRVPARLRARFAITHHGGAVRDRNNRKLSWSK